MNGTAIWIVETVGGIADKKIHQDAIDKDVARELRYGMYVASATTTVTPLPCVGNIISVLWVTTIVLKPKG